LGRFTSGAGGESAAAVRGRDIHQEFSDAIEALGGDWRANRAMPGSSLRPDAVNRGLRVVVELKPNTPSAVSSGSRQLRRYVDHMEQQLGGRWVGVLVVY
jgi:hypothetical protein